MDGNPPARRNPYLLKWSASIFGPKSWSFEKSSRLAHHAAAAMGEADSGIPGSDGSAMIICRSSDGWKSISHGSSPDAERVPAEIRKKLCPDHQP